MQVVVIEFELMCPAHGRDVMVVPVQYPRPAGCPHCFAPLAWRRELRRFAMDVQPTKSVDTEAWIG